MELLRKPFLQNTSWQLLLLKVKCRSKICFVYFTEGLEICFYLSLSLFLTRVPCWISRKTHVSVQEKTRVTFASCTLNLKRLQIYKYQRKAIASWNVVHRHLRALTIILNNHHIYIDYFLLLYKFLWYQICICQYRRILFIGQVLWFLWTKNMVLKVMRLSVKSFIDFNVAFILCIRLQFLGWRSIVVRSPAGPIYIADALVILVHRNIQVTTITIGCILNI